MYLHDLESSKYKPRKRVGRGPGSGSGKNCGRGQNPLSRRLPKFGFTSPNKVYAQLINLQNLEDAVAVETGSSLDKSKLKELGFIKKADKPVKLLGNGVLSKKLTIEVDMVSASAAEAVKKAGGEVVTTGPGRL